MLPLRISRRDILRFVPALAPGCLLQARSAADSGREPQMEFPTGGRERLSVTSWPFRNYFDTPNNRERKAGAPRMDMKQFPAFVVEKFGVQNINPLGAHFSSTDDAYLASFREAVTKAGSHLVDLGLGGRYFYDPDASARQAGIDFGCKWIDIAVKLGSPSVRQHLELHPGQKAQIEPAAESLSQLAKYGAKRNIVVNLENDIAKAEDPFVIVAVLEKVNNPYLRALPDFGNSLIGHDPEYNARGVKAMLSHAWNMCHVKDVVEPKEGQLEKVDLRRMFELSKQSSYRGYYSMEYEIDAGDPVTGTQKLVQERLQYLG